MGSIRFGAARASGVKSNELLAPVPVRAVGGWYRPLAGLGRLSDEPGGAESGCGDGDVPGLDLPPRSVS